MPLKKKRPLPFQSSLNPYQAEILNAWYARKTLREIQDDLAERGMQISLSGLSRFIRSRKKIGNPHDILLTPPAMQAQDSGVKESLRTRRDKISELIQRELSRDPTQIEMEHLQIMNQEKK